MSGRGTFRGNTECLRGHMIASGGKSAKMNDIVREIAQNKNGEIVLILAFIQKCEENMKCLCIFKNGVIQSLQVLEVKTMVFTRKTK